MTRPVKGWVVIDISKDMMLKRLLKQVQSRLVPDPDLPLEKQFFQGLCHLAGLLCIFLVLPVNAFQNLPHWENGVLFVFGLELLGLAWAARRGMYLRSTALISAVICLDLVWFPNGGSQGSIGLYFFTAALFLVVFYQGLSRAVVFVLLVADIIGLHLVEGIWPHLVHPFQNSTDRLMDLSTGYLFSLLICALMLWVILSRLNWERRRLAESERFYRELLERQGEGFGMVDGEERFTFANPVAEMIFGVPPGGLVGRNLMEFLEGPQQQQVQGETRERKVGHSSTYELDIRRPDGDVRTLLVTANPGPGDPGQAFQVIAVFRDITERKQAEETTRLLELEKHQTQKMDSLGSLAGGVAHDFNNMLGGIMGYADLLLSRESDPARQKYLRSILSAASRSSELTQKLLAFGRRGKNRVESLDLPILVEECLAILRPSMPPDLQVVVQVAGCPTVDGDPSQLRQVLMNLCLNAIEAMPERGILTISARLREWSEETLPGLSLIPGSYAELAVSDTGIGMTEETRQRIFEPFFTTKDSSQATGTGLGLSTAYGIIHAHRGCITVSSVRGRGSTFRVFLPVGTLAPALPASRVESVPGQGVILLVEDEPLLRELGTSILETLGFKVVTAVDGVDALTVFRRQNQRLRAVLLDLKMPNMGGREAFMEFRRINPGVPVIICTGYGENEEVQELLTLGATGMLAKPYRIADLAMKLGQAPVD